MELLLTLVLLLCSLAAVAPGQSAGVTTGGERKGGEAVTPELLQKVIEKDEAAFVESVERGDAAAVRLFLSAGVSTDAGRDQPGGEEVLLRASRRGHAEVVEALLDYGAGVDGEGKPDLGAALVQAVWAGQKQVVRLLLARGADPDAEVDGGHHLLMLVVGAASVADWPPEALQALVSGDDSPEEEVLLLRTPKEDRFEILRLFIEGGADLNAKASDCGMSALMVAAMFGSPEVTRLLLEKGADPNTGTKDLNPLYMATASLAELGAGNSDGSGGDPEDVSEDEQSESALYQYATTAGRAEVARLLRQAGARENWQWPDEPEAEVEKETEPARR